MMCPEIHAPSLNFMVKVEREAPQKESRPSCQQACSCHLPKPDGFKWTPFGDGFKSTPKNPAPKDTHTHTNKQTNTNPWDM